MFETLGCHPAEGGDIHARIGSQQPKPNRAERRRARVGAGWKHRGQEHQFGPDATGFDQFTAVVGSRGQRTDMKPMRT